MEISQFGNSQPPKCQDSKGSKDQATILKCAKKPAKAKSATPSPPTASPPPSSSPSPSPHHSSPNKSDNDITNHSYYQSEADSEPTKERHTKKAKAAKEHTPASGKKKEASKQASKKPFPSLPDGSSPPPSFSPQDEPEEYSKKFKASGHVAWDLLAIHNICNVDREFKVHKLMSLKGNPGYIADNYTFNCNN
ncbi:hypothetical protein DSO57_1006799 [Entomophthora muscae]|uniref:Uncharacterized protein n=1 Tax=Entomophthora muscae TaxID=34485 RepID=A0ACC2S9Q4_9FUNG|nr:hypothetical protein DSO57_1006799 [Entomophthora muscae]